METQEIIAQKAHYIIINVTFRYADPVYGEIYDCVVNGGHHQAFYSATREQAIQFIQSTAAEYEGRRWFSQDGQSVEMRVDVIWDGPNPDEETYTQIQQAAEDLRYLICASGGMATKSRVEDYLIRQFGISRYMAHNVMNDQEARNVRPVVFSGGKACWNQAQMNRLAPTPEQYPHLCKDNVW